MFRQISYIFCILFLLTILVIGIFFIWHPKPILFPGRIALLDRHGETISISSSSDGYMESYTGSLDIPLIKAIIEREDNRYWNHHGIDLIGKIASIRDNFQAKKIIRGGSTITEQYVRNSYFYGEKRTLPQKLSESLIALRIEFSEDKQSILRNYLNHIYLGNGIYGIQTAGTLYFGKADLSTLTNEEITEIIVRIKYPNLRGDIETYRQQVSLEITGDSGTANWHTSEKKPLFNPYSHLTDRIKREWNHFCLNKPSQIDLFLVEIADKHLCSQNDITLHASIDSRIMAKSTDILESTLEKLSSHQVRNAAVYVQENTTGKVLVYIGNSIQNTPGGAIDMITKRRSVGSLLKPFIALKLIEDGADGESMVLDSQSITDTQDPEKKYVSENYSTKIYGPIRLKEALGNSLNNPFIRIAIETGLSGIGKIYKQYGLNLNQDISYYGYSIAVGGVELSLENIVQSYGRLARMDSPAEYMLYTILSDDKNRSRTFGTYSILSTSIPLAVKTGTSTDFRDNWVLGYNQDITIGIWVGNSDNTSMQDISGVTGAGPIFHSIAETLIQDGYIHPNHLELPDILEEVMQCLTKNCYQQERAILWKGNIHESRVKDNLYYKSDFIGEISDQEKEKWKILE